VNSMTIWSVLKLPKIAWPSLFNSSWGQGEFLIMSISLWHVVRHWVVFVAFSHPRELSLAIRGQVSIHKLSVYSSNLLCLKATTRSRVSLADALWPPSYMQWETDWSPPTSLITERIGLPSVLVLLKQNWDESNVLTTKDNSIALKTYFKSVQLF